MSKCDLMIRLERRGEPFRAGNVVRGELVVRVNAACRCSALTVAHVWRTHGRGNPAHLETRKLTLFSGEWTPGEHHRHPFEIPLPGGPTTYHGYLLNVDHYISARADIPWALDPKADVELLVAPAKGVPYDFGSAHTPAGEKLKSSMKQRGCLVVGGGIVGGLGLVATLVCLFIAASGEEGAWAALPFTGFLLLIGMGVFLAALWQGLAQKKLGIPEVRISRSRVSPGDGITVGVTLDPRADIDIRSIDIELLGREVVVSGSGTNRTTHHHEIHRAKFVLQREARLLRKGEPASFSADVQLPENAPFTFAATDNALEWTLTLTIAIPKWPDWKQVYPITVGPPTA